MSFKFNSIAIVVQGARESASVVLIFTKMLQLKQWEGNCFLFILLDAGRGIGTETYGLDNAFPQSGICFGLDTEQHDM